MREFVVSANRRHVSAAQFLDVFQEHWIQYFGRPQTSGLGLDGSFKSAGLADYYCDKHQILLGLIPSEARWKLGICERAIQSAKHVMESLAQKTQRSLLKKRSRRPSVC